MEEDGIDDGNEEIDSRDREEGDYTSGNNRSFVNHLGRSLSLKMLGLFAARMLKTVPSKRLQVAILVNSK